MARFLILTILGLILGSAVAPRPKSMKPELRGCKLKIGDDYAGGIIFYLDSASNACHGLVCAPSDPPVDMPWNDAVALCKSLSLGGYTDWRLPTSNELGEMYLNLYKSGITKFPINYYWSSTVDINGFVYAQYFSGGVRNVHRYVYKSYSFDVCAVRAF